MKELGGERELPGMVPARLGDWIIPWAEKELVSEEWDDAGKDFYSNMNWSCISR